MSKTIELFSDRKPNIQGATALQTIDLHFEKEAKKNGGLHTKKMIRFSPSEFKLFREYVSTCNFEGFYHINDYSRVDAVREFFLPLVPRRDN